MTASSTPVAGFVINLDRSTDRLARAAAQLDAIGLPWQRISAVNADSLPEFAPETFDQRRFERNVGRAITASEIALYLSHIRAMETFAKSDARFGVIFEDDFKIDDPQAFTEMLRALIAKAALWDIVKLSGVHRHPLPVTQTHLTRSYHLAAPLLKSTGNAAYLVNREAARIVPSQLTPFDDHFDHRFDHPWRYGLKYRVVWRFPVREDRSLASTIDYRHRRAKLVWWQRWRTLFYRVGIGLRRIAYNIRHGCFVGARADD